MVIGEILEYIEINDGNRIVILDMFNLKKTEDGLIANKKTKKLMRCPYCKGVIYYKDFALLPVDINIKGNIAEPNAVICDNSPACLIEHINKNKSINW